jgi:hypothetical protein
MFAGLGVLVESVCVDVLSAANAARLGSQAAADAGWNRDDRWASSAQMLIFKVGPMS